MPHSSTSKAKMKKSTDPHISGTKRGGKKKLRKVVPGIEPGLPELFLTHFFSLWRRKDESVRIRCDNRYTIQPTELLLLLLEFWLHYGSLWVSCVTEPGTILPVTTLQYIP